MMRKPTWWWSTFCPNSRSLEPTKLNSIPPHWHIKRKELNQLLLSAFGTASALHNDHDWRRSAPCMHLHCFCIWGSPSLWCAELLWQSELVWDDQVICCSSFPTFLSGSPAAWCFLVALGCHSGSSSWVSSCLMLTCSSWLPLGHSIATCYGKHCHLYQVPTHHCSLLRLQSDLMNDDLLLGLPRTWCPSSLSSALVISCSFMWSALFGGSSLPEISTMFAVAPKYHERG